VRSEAINDFLETMKKVVAVSVDIKSKGGLAQHVPKKLSKFIKN
jgi:hypothetical protein